MQSDLILLVEDDPDDEELVVSCMDQNNLARMHTVHDGVEALHYLHQGEHELPRVVLLDLKLPRLGGLEVLRRIRAHPRTALLPVVIMTSSKQDGDKINSYRGGANSFVTKPIDFDQFREAVRQLGLYWAGLNETAEV